MKKKMQLNHDTCCNDTKLNNTINHSNWLESLGVGVLLHKGYLFNCKNTNNS
jgi:hypothetical protein